jgi:stress response protein YsnF
MKTVVGIFSDAGEARRAFDELVRSGFGQADISVVTGLATQNAMNLELRPMDTADTGRVAGRGPFADAMWTNRAPGLSGLLTNYGFSPELVDHYTRAVRQGETLESLVVEDKDADRAVSIMTRHAALYGGDQGAGAREDLSAKKVGIGAAAAGVAARRSHFDGEPEQGERTIPILREEIRVGKRDVERAHVHVGVHVAERPINEKVSLREEHVEIERRATNRTPRADEISFKDAALDITEYGEEPVICKEVKVVEEVVVKKTLGGRDEAIRDTVRNTYVDVAEDRFDKSLYQKHFASLGAKGKFEEHVPAYELGHSLRGAGSRWEDIETKARSDWESKRPGTWETVKESVRHAFSRGRS